jgi:glycosyltransferase involved in cell wall biosynthesis
LGAVSTRLLVHDNFLAQRLGYFVDAEKIQVIAHGTSGAKRLTKKTRQNARRELGIADDETAVLVFGYRSWYKGTDWIVKNLAEVIQENPKAKIKFILAGGDSPTLRDTTAYKAFTRRLSGLLESHQKRVITLGFVPEKNVKDLFASCDIVVFPYRARMSASGALSLAFGYGKPVLVSKPFSENFVERDIENVFKYNKVEPERLSFRLSKAEFENKLFSLLANKRLLVSLAKAGFEIADKRSWKNIAALYLAVCTSPAGAVELAKEQGLSYATQES